MLEDLETDNVNSAVRIINKSYINKLNTEGGKEKVIAALMRRGFSYSDIRSAFNVIENE